jgi:hypothetical protein
MAMTNETKATYTPPPWVAEQGKLKDWFVYQRDRFGRALALIYVNGLDHAEVEANARLIAAAPDYDKAADELLKVHATFNNMILSHKSDAEIVAYLDRAMDHVASLTEAAIAKVRGEHR